MRNRKSAWMVAASAMALGTSAPATAQEPYLGQMIEVGFTYCPRGFANADGQLLAISTNQALFSLLGTTYGGNGSTTFALPNLRGRMMIHAGSGPGLSSFQDGQQGGSEAVQLTIGHLPSHVHRAGLQTVSTSPANERRPFRNAFAFTADKQYSNNVANLDATMHADTVITQNAGDGVGPTPMMSPFLVTRYCIALQGIFPSRN